MGTILLKIDFDKVIATGPDLPYGWVYGLYCPITSEIKYIGKTTKLADRKLQHSTTSICKKKQNERLHEWIESLLQNHHKPLFEILRVCKDAHEYMTIEKALIKEFSEKHELLNIASNPKRMKPRWGKINDN